MPEPTAADLTALPRFYTHWDVLALFGTEAAFLDAWISGALPADIRKACYDTMGDAYFHGLLLQRLSRQLTALSAQMDRLIAVVSEPVGGYPPAEG